MAAAPVVLPRGGLRWALLTAGGLLLLAGLLYPLTGVSSLVVWAVVLALITLWGALVRRGPVVTLTEETIIVEDPRLGRQEHSWGRLLEVSWQGGDRRGLLSGITGGGPVIRPRGGRWDVPGPNAPVQIAYLPVYGPFATRRAVGLLRAAAEAHGVPFTEHLLANVATGRRPSPPDEPWGSPPAPPSSTPPSPSRPGPGRSRRRSVRLVDDLDLPAS